MRKLYLINNGGYEYYDYVKITDEQYKFFKYLEKKGYLKDCVDMIQVDKLQVDEP